MLISGHPVVDREVGSPSSISLCQSVLGSACVANSDGKFCWRCDLVKKVVEAVDAAIRGRECPANDR